MGSQLKLEALRTIQVQLAAHAFSHEFVVGQIREDCMLGVDFLNKWSTMVDLTAGVYGENLGWLS